MRVELMRMPPGRVGSVSVLGAVRGLGVAQGPAGQGEEHVVERRAVHLDGLQRDAAGLELAEQGRDHAPGALHPPADPAADDVDVAGDGAQPLGRVRDLVVAGDLEVDEVPGDLRLEVVTRCPRRRSGRGR